MSENLRNVSSGVRRLPTPNFNVIKRDGTVQPFSRPKLSNSIVRAGATRTQANQISRTVANQLSTQPKVTTQQVSNLTTQQLININTTAAQQYATYQKPTSEELVLAAQGPVCARATGWTNPHVKHFQK
jgi:transcriptional regulator NrdR family protein